MFQGSTLLLGRHCQLICGQFPVCYSPTVAVLCIPDAACYVTHRFSANGGDWTRDSRFRPYVAQAQVVRRIKALLPQKN